MLLKNSQFVVPRGGRKGGNSIGAYNKSWGRVYVCYVLCDGGRNW
jgi:hypothetical protein